jgi:hypothetical protein
LRAIISVNWVESFDSFSVGLGMLLGHLPRDLCGHSLNASS